MLNDVYISTKVCMMFALLTKVCIFATSNNIQHCKGAKFE
nr:MAG TPA: hypothetical protein [Caudoviricetes sp.]DAU63561.1 MAG TPA: hypothetical protein [Caudoviricetes sp.]DAZ30149.1 MAG TPA: hypothetical protein [Caudoviricetes sp.]